MDVSREEPRILDSGTIQLVIVPEFLYNEEVKAQKDGTICEKDTSI